MKRFKINVIAGAVFLMSLAGCSQPAAAPVSSGTTTGSKTAKTSAVVIVIDENGLTMTNPDGTPETSVVTDLTTGIVTVTDSSGKIVTQTNGTPVTSVITAPTIPATTTTTGRTTVKADPASTTTTTAYTTTTKKPVITTTTTKKPTTTTKKTTTTTKKPTTTTTKNASGDPWKYPYDVNQISKDTKAYALSIGLEWDDTLATDNSYWVTPRSTVPWTHNAMNISLEERVRSDLREIKEMGFEVLNLYLEPDTEDIGDYWVYYLLG
jgi:cell division septation protein DedD